MIAGQAAGARQGRNNNVTLRVVLVTVALTYATTSLLYNIVWMSEEHTSPILTINRRTRQVWSVFSTVGQQLQYAVLYLPFIAKQSDRRLFMGTVRSVILRAVLVMTQQCSEFQDWNSVVVVKAHQHLSIQGPIVRLMSCKNEDYNPPHIDYERYRFVRLPEHNPLHGDDFPPRNKGYNVNDWLNGNGTDLPRDEDVIILMDPDQLYINHVDVSEIREGHALAAGYSLAPTFFELAKPFCDGACDEILDPETILYGAPYIITAGDLRKLAPEWNRLTEVFRKQKALKSWLTEMYSYIVAALKLGIKHRKDALMLSHPEDDLEPWQRVRWHGYISPPLAFIHFCQSYKIGSLTWSKHAFHSLDLRKCDRSVLFEEPQGHNQRILEALEGTPLGHHSDHVTREQLFVARSAFLYTHVVPFANEAFKSYFESNCPWHPRAIETLPTPTRLAATKPAAAAPLQSKREPVLWTVVSTQCSPFNDWNTIVAAESHQRLNIQGPFVRLMACNDDAYEPPQSSYSRYRLVRLPDHNPKNGDDFAPRNKGYNVRDWLNGVSADSGDLPHEDDVIALVDPDQIYIAHLDISSVRSGHAVAAGYSLDASFFDVVKEFCNGACDTIADRNALLYGAPYMITAGDMKRMATLWTQLTEQFREKQEIKDRFGWLTEMYSYIIAALRYNIVHQKSNLMISNANDGLEPWHLARWYAQMKPPLSFIHFCQAYQVGDTKWGKHDHHQLDVRTCKKDQLFAELTGPDLAQMRLLEGMPLGASDDADQLAKTRSAFLYQQVVTNANRALRGYYEEWCTGSSKSEQP